MRFLADRTTGRLARKLRALGFDVLYQGGGQLEEAARVASSEDRWFLTRSRRLQGKGREVRVIVVEADDPRKQVREVLTKLKLELEEEKFFSRCLMCNEILLQASKEEVEGKVPDFIYRAHESFHICPRCRRVYWPGTHLQRMKRDLSSAVAGKSEDLLAKGGKGS
jgi:uncharacterized protein with PIN domain